MGGKGGSKAPAQQTVTNVSKLPAFAEKFLTQASDRATQLTTPQDQFFPGSTVAGFSPTQQEFFSRVGDFARTPNPVLTSAQGNIADTLSGQFFGAAPGTGLLEQTVAGDFLPGGTQDPVFRNQLNAILNRQLPQVSSTFEQFGRTGSGLADTARAQVASDAFAGLAFQQQEAERQRQQAAAGQLADIFGNERQRQLGALGISPQILQAELGQIGALQSVGQAERGLNQAQINEQIQRFNFDQDIERQQALQLLGLGGAVSGAGGTTTQTGPGQAQPQSSPLAGALGGAATGFSIAGPFGALGGALLGGLLS